MTAREYFEQLRTIESDIRRYGEALDAAEARIEGLRSMGSSHGSGATDTDAIPRRIAQLEEARDRYARAFDQTARSCAKSTTAARPRRALAGSRSAATTVRPTTDSTAGLGCTASRWTGCRRASPSATPSRDARARCRHRRRRRAGACAVGLHRRRRDAAASGAARGARGDTRAVPAHLDRGRPVLTCDSPLPPRRGRGFFRFSSLKRNRPARR